MNTRRKTNIRGTTHEAMLSCCDVGQHKMSACVLSFYRFPPEVPVAVLNEETGELMGYRHLIGNPKYQTVWQ